MKQLYSLIVLLLICNGLKAQELTATQNFPSNVYPGKDFTIEITINKGSLTGFMKFAQELPEGYTATVIESKSGSFTYADNAAKVVWINPPSDASFTISYKVSVPANATGSVNLTGKVSYIQNNERKVFDLEKKYFVVGNNGVAVSVTESKPGGTPVAITPVKTEEKAPVEIKKESTPVVVPQTTTTSTKAPATAVATSTGKVYKVQIGAYSQKPKLEGVPNISTFVLDNGITKYFSGNFSNYDEAVQHKKLMLEKGFAGAFIVVFENGKIVK